MDKAGLMESMMEGGQGGEAPQAEAPDVELLKQIFAMVKDIHDAMAGGQGGQQAAPPPQQ